MCPENILVRYEPEGRLPYRQEPATGPYKGPYVKGSLVIIQYCYVLFLSYRMTLDEKYMFNFVS